MAEGRDKLQIQARHEFIYGTENKSYKNHERGVLHHKTSKCDTTFKYNKWDQIVSRKQSDERATRWRRATTSKLKGKQFTPPLSIGVTCVGMDFRCLQTLFWKQFFFFLHSLQSNDLKGYIVISMCLLNNNKGHHDKYYPCNIITICFPMNSTYVICLFNGIWYTLIKNNGKYGASLTPL